MYDTVRRPRAQGVVQASSEVGLEYFLVHPDFGDDLQKITDDANKSLPELWWYDLEGDVRKVERMFLDNVSWKSWASQKFLNLLGLS